MEHHDARHRRSPQGRALTRLAISATLALPHRLRDRRGPRHGHRHRPGLERPADDRAGGRAGVLLRLRLHHGPVMRSGLALCGGDPGRAGRRHRLDHRHGDRRQRRHGPRPGRDGGRAGQPAVLGQPRRSRSPSRSSSPCRSTAGSSAGARATPWSTSTTTDLVPASRAALSPAAHPRGVGSPSAVGRSPFWAWGST